MSVQLGAKRCLLDDSIMQVDVRGDVREAICPRGVASSYAVAAARYVVDLRSVRSVIGGAAGEPVHL